MSRISSSALVVTTLIIVLSVVWYVVLVPEDSPLSATTFLLLLLLIVAAGITTHVVFLRTAERALLSPLERIKETTQAIVEGASSGRIELDTKAYAQVREIATVINQLAAKASNDMTEMRRLERVRSEFVGNVSHELRTPIFSVQGYLETLLDGAIDDPEVSREFLEKAFSNALRLNALLNDLIDISRIESGELRFSFRYFDIVGLIRDVATALEIRAEQRNVTVRVSAAGADVVSVYGDKERLTQVLTNLVDNAIKYNAEGGTVDVSAVPEGKFIRITVADSGIGIDEPHLDRIFERFYRVDKDRSRKVGGTGLGLAIVKHILEAHHAPITVTSVKGEGTTISFLLKGP